MKRQEKRRADMRIQHLGVSSRQGFLSHFRIDAVVDSIFDFGTGHTSTRVVACRQSLSGNGRIEHAAEHVVLLYGVHGGCLDVVEGVGRAAVAHGAACRVRCFPLGMVKKAFLWNCCARVEA